MVFREYVRSKLLKSSDRILEFGPLTRAMVDKTTHPGVCFADVRSTEDIRKLYTSNDYLESTGINVDLDSIVNIDYVIKDTYKETFRGAPKFDALVLSHVIEHMPDIISFFKDASGILKKDGKIVIIYPDARYCFDHFRNGTSFIDAYDVYMGNNKSSSRVFDFVNNVVHENDPALFWNDPNQTRLLPRNDFTKTLDAYTKAADNILPDDTHFWPFSDYQLIKFLYDMDRAGILDFDIDEFYPTQENTQEFMVILKLKSSKKINYDKYEKYLKSVSPSIRRIQDSVQISNLRSESEKLKIDNDKIRAENQVLQDELEEIYSSKKWAYVKKIAEIRGRVSTLHAKK